MIVIAIEVIIILISYSSNTDHHKILTNGTVMNAVNISDNSISQSSILNE